MKDYKRLGDYIREVNVRNRELEVTNPMGININKHFMPSVANVIGTDLSTYKLVSKMQFACNLMHVGRDEKIPMAMYTEDNPIIVSPAYFVFEVTNNDQLLPEYLMMWFKRPEFDRYARFHSHGSAREVFDWSEMCDVLLPIPSIEQQREIVSEYETISKRIKLNEQIIKNLEVTAQTLYRKMFVEGIDKENLPEGWRIGTIKEFCKQITSGGTPNRSNNNYWNKKDYRWLKTGEVHNNIVLDTEEYISEEGLNNSSAKVIPKGSITFAMYCANGVTGGQVAYLDCETTTNQACCNMICNSKLEAAYLFFYFINRQKEIKRLANGAAQENLSQELIAQQQIILIENKEQISVFVPILDNLIVLNYNLCFWRRWGNKLIIYYG